MSLKKGVQNLQERLSAKRRKTEEVKEQTFFSLQVLASEPTGTTQKYKRIGALQSIKLIDNEETIENVCKSCLMHFNYSNKVCDVLLGERGPTVRSFSQLSIKKVIHCRFLQKQMSENNENDNQPSTTNPLNQTTGVENISACSQPSATLQSKIPPAATSVIPKSVSFSHYMKVGQLVKPQKEMVDLIVEEFDVNLKKWKDPVVGKFIVDKEDFAKGGFRRVFKAKCFGGMLDKGQYVIKSMIDPSLFEDTLEVLTRKNVQMHSLARHMAKCMSFEWPEEFGQTFYYSKCYYSKMNGQDIAIEPFIEGDFQKYVNNDGTLVAKESEFMSKVETFMHYTYKKSDGAIMVTDIQGIGFHLTDPEIASKDARDENNKWLFCPGNSAIFGITEFLLVHKCNNYCQYLKL